MITVGDRVSTPDGPGVVMNLVQLRYSSGRDAERLVLVDLDSSPKEDLSFPESQWRSYFADKLEVLT